MTARDGPRTVHSDRLRQLPPQPPVRARRERPRRSREGRRRRPHRAAGKRRPHDAPLTSRTHRDERGITTAEYAVGTAAGAGLAGLLYKLLTGGFGDQLLKTLFDHVLGLLGIG